MPRIRRFLQDGLVYHVLNRGNRRSQIFRDATDYEEFLTALVDAMRQVEMRLLAFCLMPNHWHMVMWPHKGDDLSTYMQSMMNVHVRRYHGRYGTWGLGHLYQARLKSFPIEDDRHLLTVLRYVESNASKARLVNHAEDWPWSSLVRTQAVDGRALVVPGPINRPPDWLSVVNANLSTSELFDIRRSVTRQLPFGSEKWTQRLRENGRDWTDRHESGKDSVQAHSAKPTLLLPTAHPPTPRDRSSIAATSET
jgi:putative transposase